MPTDDLEHIPSITATREDAPRSPAGKARTQRKGKGGTRTPSGGGGAGVWARIFITVALVVAAVACAWAFQLQEQLRQSELAMQGYAERIADLEDRLSDTDEGMNENAAVQAARIKGLTEESKRLDSEVRKLWDNVWKQAKQRLSALESSSKSQAGKISAAEKSIASTEAKMVTAQADLAKLKSVAGDLERLMSSARSNQEEVERVADELNRINLEFAKLSKRVEGNEEWLDSINAFRRQINAAVADLNASVRALQSAP